MPRGSRRPCQEATGPHPSTLGRFLMVHILVVDDDEAVLGLIGAVFRSPECTVDLLSNGTEALAQFSEREYDLVVTDFRMPGMNGLELASAIRALDTEVPIILITGTPQDL